MSVSYTHLPICGKDVPPRYGARESVYCSRACLNAHYDAAWETITLSLIHIFGKGRLGGRSVAMVAPNGSGKTSLSIAPAIQMCIRDRYSGVGCGFLVFSHFQTASSVTRIIYVTTQ